MTPQQLLRASAIRYGQATKQLSDFYYLETGKCRYCGCVFNPVFLVSQNVKILGNLNTHSFSIALDNMPSDIELQSFASP